MHSHQVRPDTQEESLGDTRGNWTLRQVSLDTRQVRHALTSGKTRHTGGESGGHVQQLDTAAGESGHTRQVRHALTSGKTRHTGRESGGHVQQLDTAAGESGHTTGKTCTHIR